MNTNTILAILAVVGTTAIYQASNWWERAFATYDSSNTSPDGCIRIDTYEPFWLLPSPFHRIPQPGLTEHYHLGKTWVTPTFKRAYEATSGELLGETVVFDPSLTFSDIYWGDPDKPGRRIVRANGFPIADTTRCSDEATLTKLKAFNAAQRFIL